MLGRQILLAAIGTLIALLLCEALLTLYPGELAATMKRPRNDRDASQLHGMSLAPAPGSLIPKTLGRREGGFSVTRSRRGPG